MSFVMISSQLTGYTTTDINLMTVVAMVQIIRRLNSLLLIYHLEQKSFDLISKVHEINFCREFRMYSF